jgi:biopolymer transport protein ExbB/TolQ
MLSPTMVGLLCAAVTALAATVGYLFKFYSTKMSEQSADRRKIEAEHADERKQWAVERARADSRVEIARAELKAEYEKSFREILEDARKHEDEVRRDYARNIDGVAEQLSAAHDRLTVVMDKFYERFVNGGRRRDY